MAIFELKNAIIWGKFAKKYKKVQENLSKMASVQKLVPKKTSDPKALMVATLGIGAFGAAG